MALQITGAVQDSLMDKLKADLDGGYIRIYDSGGTPPTDPSFAVVGTLLAIISESGGSGGLNFNAASGGVISKATAEEWIGTVLADGTADYYRYSPISDAGGLDDTIKRVQGDIGEAIGELLLADTTLVTDDDQRIDYYSLGIPGE